MDSETVRMALITVRRNALRSFLTLLGVVIGVAALICTVTIGRGTTVQVQRDIAKLGSNLLVVRAGNSRRPGGPRAIERPLKDKDLAALTSELRDVMAVSAATMQTLRVVHGADSFAAVVTGADNQFLKARDWALAAGRPFSADEAKGVGHVCLIGETVRTRFFGTGDPLGVRLRVGRLNCKVVGLLEAKGFSGFGADQDNVVILPLTTFQRRISGSRDIGVIYISATDKSHTRRVQRDIVSILREARRIAPDEESDFDVYDMSQVADTVSSTTKVMTGLIGSLSAVSLLVGGIGIMNIMLVSVTERTREIGIRLAIGARERHILLQFLVEATVLSLIGGLAGVLLGLGMAGLATWWIAVPYIPSPAVIVLALGFSAITGMVFGFFPALRGARLDPIEALRHE